jgi:membrane-associated protein
LINPLCGIIGIPAKKFFIWNIIGSCIWTVSLITAGYLLGERLEGSVDKYLLPIVVSIIAISLAPILIELIRSRRRDF